MCGVVVRMFCRSGAHAIALQKVKVFIAELKVFIAELSYKYFHFFVKAFDAWNVCTPAQQYHAPFSKALLWSIGPFFCKDGAVMDVQHAERYLKTKAALYTHEKFSPISEGLR